MAHSETEPGRLSRDPEKGWVLAGDTRVVLLAAKTLQTFVDRLVSLSGGRVAATLLYHTGIAVGQSGFETERGEIRSEEDLWRMMDSVLSAAGWGRFRRGEIRKLAGHTSVTVQMIGSPLSHGRSSREPTCDLLRGMVVGWVEAYFGKKARSSLEATCASKGDEFCVFEMTFPDWVMT